MCGLALSASACSSSSAAWRWLGGGASGERGADGRWRERTGAYSILDLAAPHVSSGMAESAPLAFRRVRVEGAELAYRGPSGSTLTLLRECGRADAPIALLARQLRIGAIGEGDELLDSSKVAIAGEEGFAQLFRAFEGRESVLVRSVTLRSGGCTYDWVLVGAGDAAVDAAFERWWRSFEPTRGGAQ